MKEFNQKMKIFFAKNEIARLSVILCAITSVTAFLLGTVNGITAPIIEELEIKATNEAMQAIVTTAEGFTAMEIPEGSNSLVTEFYQGTAGEEIVGYCVKVTPSGYGGDITIVVGFDAEGAVVGTSVVDHAETPGLGSKIIDQPSFAEQFIGKATSLIITKTGASAENEIDAISGATISSTAMTLGVSTAIEFLAENK